MTMQDDALGDAAESAVKIVKLTAGDWRKLALVILALFLGGSAIAYNLVIIVAKNEVSRLDDKDTAFSARLEDVEHRLKRIEDMQSDVAVLRNDVSWIRKELEKENRR